MIVLLTGSRDWENPQTIFNELDAILLRPVRDEPFELKHGGAVGADTFGSQWFRQHPHRNDTWTETVFPYIHEIGKRGGPVRNKQMVDSGAEICLAFIRNRSSGASGCARLAKAAGIHTEIFREPEIDNVPTAFLIGKVWVAADNACWLYFRPCGCLGGVMNGDEAGTSYLALQAFVDPPYKRRILQGHRVRIVTRKDYRENWFKKLTEPCTHDD